MSETQNGSASNTLSQTSQAQADTSNILGQPTRDDDQDSQQLEKEVTEACLAIVQDYRAGGLSKAQATLQLHGAFPDTLDEDAFVEAFRTYFEMLDNFDRFRDGAGQHGHFARESGVTEDPTTAASERLHDPARSQVDRPPKRGRPSDDTDDEDDGYKKQTRLDFDALPWNQGEVVGSTVVLSPSLQKTQSLLANFARDLKRAKTSLLNCGKSYPQFPDSEWGNLLGGKSVDFDHVLSGMYSISHDDKEAQPIGRGLEIIRGSAKPAKSVRTHGEWIMAFNAYVEATLFIFPHREHELRAYGNHIMRYFASTPSDLHDRIINYDKAVRIRVAQRRDLELTSTEQFSDLHLQWINNPAACSGTSRNGRRAGQRRDPCRRWNENRCPNSAGTCNYAHICSRCRSNAHVGSECQVSQRK